MRAFWFPNPRNFLQFCQNCEIGYFRHFQPLAEVWTLWVLLVCSIVDVGACTCSGTGMTFFIVILLAAVRVTLLLRVDHRDPVLYHGLKLRRIYPVEAERRHDGDWASLAGLLDSATGRRASWMRADRFDEELHPSRLSHPIYLGMGHNAVDQAFKTYINIVSPSARNPRKFPINPVNFVGKR